MAQVDSLEIQIAVSAQKAEAALDSLAKKMGTVGSALNTLGVKSNFTQMSNSFAKMTGNFSSMNKSTKSLTSSMTKLYVGVKTAQRAFRSLADSMQESISYIENLNYFTKAFEQVAEKADYTKFQDFGYASAEEYAKSFAARASELTAKMTGFKIGTNGMLEESGGVSLGINPSDLITTQATFAQMASSMGATSEQSLKLSNALTMLGADLASVRNMDFSKVWTDLQSGLAGMSRTMDKYGSNIRLVNLQLKLNDIGIAKSVSALNQNEKALLRTIIMLDSTRYSWADLSETINQPANQLRLLSANFENLGRTIGNLFLPIVSKVLPYINALTISLQRLFAWVGNLVGLDLSGITSSTGDTNISELLGTDEATDGINSATNALKKLKTVTLGIDELNINAPQSESGSDGSGVGLGSFEASKLNEAFNKAVEEYQKMWDEAFDKIENRAKLLADQIDKFFEPIKNMIENLFSGNFEDAGENLGEFFMQLMDIDWDSIYAKASGFGRGLAEFLNGLISPTLFGKVGETIAGVLNTSIYQALAFAENFDWTDFGNSLAEGVNKFFQTFDFASLADTIDAWVQGIWETISTAIKEIDWLTAYDKITEFLENMDIETIAIIVGALTIKKIGSLILTQGLISWISSSLSKLLTNIPVAISSIKILASGGLIEGTSVVAKLADSLALAAGGAGTLNEALTLAFGSVATTAAGIMTIVGGAIISITNFVSMLKDGFSWIKEALMVVGIALAGVGAVILGAPAAITALIAGIVAGIGTIVVLVKDNWEAIKGFFADVGDWLNTNVITPVVELFKGLWISVSGFFSNLWTDIVSVWSSVKNWFSSNVIEPIILFFEGFSLRVGQIIEGLWIIVQAVWIIASTWVYENFIVPVTEMFTMLWENIQLIWGFVATWFNENLIIPLVTFFTSMSETVILIFTTLWEGIKAVWATFSTWINKTVITPFQNAFQKACESIKGFFDKLWVGIKSGVCGAMNAVIGGIESAINFIVDGINGILGGFNKVVSWAAKVAEVDWGGVDLISRVSLQRIPAYSTGGFPEDGLFFANHNELVGQFSNGRTAVANNEQIVAGIKEGVREAVAEILAPYLADIAQNTRETADKDLTVAIGDREIARANARGQRSLGYQLIT